MSEPDSPLYVQIADQLRRRVQQGQYAVGDRLPAEGQLAEQFGVNRHTLRQAVGLLRQEGTLRVERGKGTFVAAAPIRYAIGKRVRYNEALKAQGLTIRYELVRSLEVLADDTLSEALTVELNAAVALLERVSFVDGQPLSVSSGYFPLALFSDLLAAESLQQFEKMGSVSKWLRDRYSVDHIRLRTSVSARLVQPNDAKLLALQLNQPNMLAESVNVDQHGRVIEYGVTRFRGDRMEMVFENQ